MQWWLAILMPFLLLGLVAVCRRTHGCCRGSSFVPRLCAFLLVIRFGEATNPGPDIDSFVIGVANPTGLRSKAPYVAAHMSYGDVWALSETHLCAQGIADFNTGLKFADAPFQPLLGGCPVPANKTNSGCWKGVGVLSKTPVRKLPHSWADDVAFSSRAMIFTTLVDDFWLSGGIVYGEPESHLYPDRFKHTEALLQEVVGSICFLSTGHRFVAGDWNVSIDELPVFTQLAQAGFRDLQDLAAERWAISPKPTCKHRTRKDFCFVSPELQELLFDVRIVDDIWPDHSILQGHFHRLCMTVPKDVWRMPGPFPWPAQWTFPAKWWDLCDGSPSFKYAKLWEALEQVAEQALPFKPSKHVKGRAQTQAPKCVVGGRLAPVKIGRRGDFHPQFHGASCRHAQWVRQVRRLQAYLRSVQAHGNTCQYAQEVWLAIVSAKGFPGGFRAWWYESASKTFDAPLVLPWCPPDAAVARSLFETMSVEVRLLEAKLKSTSRQYARMRRAKNPNVLFKDLKAAPANGVDFLLKPLQAKVVCLNDDASMALEPSQPCVLDRPIFCNGQQLEVIHVEPDCIWTGLEPAVAVGSLVTQLKTTGTKQALEDAFLHEWSQRWDRHKDVPHARWDAILSFARAHLPRGQLTWPALTCDSLMQLISRKKPGSSSGLDGVSLLDLQSMPSGAHEVFVHMFAEAEREGTWPQQLLVGKVACLAKKEHPQDVMDYRPITVLGLLYRCWGSFHARHAIRQLESFLPETLYGSRPSRFAGQVWCQLLWAVEDSLSSGIALSGVFADIQKAFNCLPRLVVMEAAALLGIPFSLLIAWAGALSQLGRRFQIGQNLSAAAYSVTGLPEGDGLSCLGMVIIDILFHLWHGFFFPMAQPISYVDDWTLLTTNPAFIEGSVQCLNRFTEALDLQLDLKKTCAWSVCSSGRRLLKSQGFRVVDGCRSLRAHVQTTRKHTNSTQMERVAAVSSLWAKLRMSACAYVHKVRALRTAAWPKCLHAISATTIALQAFVSLRAGAMKGLGADGAGCNSFLHLGLIE